MGGAKRQLEEYEEFLVNRPPVRMNADTQANILTMALEATRLDLEKNTYAARRFTGKENQTTIFIRNKCRY